MPTTTRWKPSFSPSPSTRKSVSTPSRKFFRTQGCFVKLLQGWILDLYPNQHGMTLWLIDRNQSHYRLTDSFAPAFYVSGTDERLVQLRDAAQRTNHRASHAIYRAHRPVAECAAPGPRSFRSLSLRISSAGDDGCTSSTRDCSSTTATSWWRRSIAGRSGLFPLSLMWKSKRTTKGKSNPSHAAMMNGRSIMKCRHSRSCRFGLSGLSRIDPTHGRRAALEIEMDGTCWELDETGEPPAIQFARIAQTRRPRRDSFRVGRLDYSSVASPAGRTLASLLCPSIATSPRPSSNPAAAATRVTEGFFSRRAAITLFGRIHVDKQNSFISEKCDFAGLWELARLTKLPIQYAARTTTGTGISYMQMELAHRDGVLIPEQKAEPEDPKHPDELLCADRGGLVFVPKLGFTANVAELDFVSQFPSIMARFNISPETVNCPCCPDAPRIPELGYRICQKRGGITSRVVERLIAKRCELKKLLKTTPPDTALQVQIAARFDEVASCLLLRLYRLQERALRKNRSA